MTAGAALRTLGDDPATGAIGITETASRPPASVFGDYDPGPHWCEMFEARGRPRPHVAELVRRLEALGLDELVARWRDAETELFNLGITFVVYSADRSVDRILPFDVFPRVIAAAEWQRLERGLAQRVRTLNLFLADVYGPQKVLADGVVPREMVLGHPHYRPEMRGMELPHGTWVHIAGIDVVRDRDGTLRVLEDNARVPSGVAYVVENRHLTMRLFADVAEGIPIAGVSDYGQRLHETLCELAPAEEPEPQVVLLTPGVFNAAYFEHVFLAREMGVQLVEGRDLFVGEDDRVYVKTIAGAEPVHVIYRRIGDDFLDPEVFRPESLIGVPGLFRAYRAGKVQIANAVGTGVVDDKGMYALLPRLVRYYLGEDPILESVPTWLCREADSLRYVLDHLDELVVKPVGEAGGYGVVIGPQASRAELGELRDRLRADPANYIAQPVVDLSVGPTLVENRVEPRHLDLRPFVLTGSESWTLPGGLTRVALRRGSLVVNSSQGGGSKDTWVLEAAP